MGTKLKLVSVLWRSPMPTLIRGQVVNAHETKWWVKGVFSVVEKDATPLGDAGATSHDSGYGLGREKLYHPLA